MLQLVTVVSVNEIKTCAGDFLELIQLWEREKYFFNSISKILTNLSTINDSMLPSSLSCRCKRKGKSGKFKGILTEAVRLHVAAS